MAETPSRPAEPSLPEVLRRQLRPMLSMLRKMVDDCPEDLWSAGSIGVREHAYHAMLGADIWLSAGPGTYPFGEIAEPEAAELNAPATEAISRDALLKMLQRLEGRVDALPDEPGQLLAVQELRGRQFTLLDRVLGQLRHVQHHIGAANELLRAAGHPVVPWTAHGQDA